MNPPIPTNSPMPVSTATVHATPAEVLAALERLHREEVQADQPDLFTEAEVQP